MVARTLDDNRISDGKSLVQALEVAGLRVPAALWFLFPESEKWKLVIALPDLEAEGPRRAYEEIQKVMERSDRRFSFPISDVTVAPQKWTILGLLRSAIQTGPDLSEIRFTGNAVNGQYIADALIYRLN